MKENKMDRLTDKLNARMGRISGRISKENKNINPYRMERIPDEQRLDDYANLTNEDIEFGMQHFPQETPEYLAGMEELLRRQK